MYYPPYIYQLKRWAQIFYGVHCPMINLKTFIPVLGGVLIYYHESGIKRFISDKWYDEEYPTP